MSRRDAILAEMGLAPVWRLRRGDARLRHREGVAEPATGTAGAVDADPEMKHGNPVSAPPLAQVAEAHASREARIAALGWPELKATVAGCRDCKLRAGCTQTVFGVGDEAADWMIVGEAPGAEEDRQGEPFVGRAGQLLTAMIRALGFSREEVYIANVLKCRPSGNRDPKPEEVRACRAYLERQIELVSPTLIVAVGRIAAQTLLETDTPLAKLRGRVHGLGAGRRPLVVTYHPAYLLRSPGEKRKAWQDLLFAREVFERLAHGEALLP